MGRDRKRSYIHIGDIDIDIEYRYRFDLLLLLRLRVVVEHHKVYVTGVCNIKVGRTPMQATQATPTDELADKSTDQLVSRYLMARREHANFDGWRSTDAVVRAAEEARNVEDVLENRGVSIDKLREFWSLSDWSDENL